MSAHTPKVIVGAACLLALLAFGGCNLDTYIYISLDGSAITSDGQVTKSDACSACVKSNNGIEICDGKDNDCDCDVDEGFDLKSDTAHCGKCNNSCVLPGAMTACYDGGCVFRGCAAGFKDLDLDLKTGWFAGSNGCECTLSALKKEICDNLDNDCNGTVDDLYKAGTKVDLTTDKSHCGACNNSCLLPNAVVDCVSSKCTFTGCTGGYINADKVSTNGCECLPSSPTTEVCDGVDNDCDGNLDKTSGGVALTQTCYTGTSGTSGKGNCKDGNQTCSNGFWTTCKGEINPKREYCDGVDTDCDGAKDPAACVFTVTNAETRLDDPQNTTLGAANSTQLTVAGAGANVLAVWVDRRNKRSDIFTSTSADGGKSWLAQDVAAASETYDKLQPQVAMGGGSGSSRRAYITYQRFVPAGTTSPGLRDLYLRRSTDGGKTWQSPVSIKVSGTTDVIAARLGVVQGTSLDRVVVCWEQISISGAKNPNIFCSLSTDSGAVFSSPVQVNSIANNASAPDLAVGSSYAYLAWQQGQKITVSRAVVTGSSLTFTTNTALDAGAGQRPRIKTDSSGLVAVVWEDVSSSLSNIKANHSKDYGATWLSSGVRVDLDTVDGDSTSPVLDIEAGGRVLVAWEDTSRGKRDIYVNTSSDSGATWNTIASRVPSHTAGATQRGRPALVTDPASKNVYVAWEDQRNGTYNDIYFSVSLDDGKNWNVPDYRINEPAKGTADASRPVLWISPARVAVLWTDNRMKTGSTITTGAHSDIYCSHVE